MKIEKWCKTDTGLKRQSNQDYFKMNPELSLFIVADGMGGHSGGEIASAMAVETVDQFIKSNISTTNQSPKDLFISAYADASKKIYEVGTKEKPELLGMGTTMVSLMILKNKVYIANVGDSRCYLYRRPHLWQLTEDHSLVNEQLRSGMINEQQAQHFVGKNVITRSVGFEREVSVDVIERPLTSGDLFLLCSDGLCGLVSDRKISEILNACSTNELIVDKCIESALAHGGDDNVTVMVVNII